MTNNTVYVEIESHSERGSHYTYSYFYSYPCGNKFFIIVEDLDNGEKIATYPRCILKIKVIYDPPDDEDE
jgi:diphthamide biosynthesis protein 3